MDKKNEKKVMAKEALKVINELEETTRMENVIKDNKIEFKVKDKIFRVRKPNLTEQQDANKFRRKRYIELVNDDSFLFRKQWIKKYKVKGIDIEKMDAEIHQKQKEMEALLLRLAKLDNVKEIEKIKKDVLKLRDEQYEISIEKTDFLAYSIEDQLLISVNSYITYLVLEYKDKEKWDKYFESYKKFQESEEKELVNKAYYYINHLIYSK